MPLPTPGLAYAGSQKENVAEVLLPIVQDPDERMEVAGYAALALGYVYLGSCNEEAVGAVLNALMLHSTEDLAGAPAMFLCVGLGLLFLGT